MSQYTTQLLMPELEAYIDDMQHANYSIPELQHDHRKLVQRDRVSSAFEYEHVEEDYVDARAGKTCLERCVENPRVGGSIPPQATKQEPLSSQEGNGFFFVAHRSTLVAHLFGWH